MDMLPPFIIQQLREREERTRRSQEREQPRLELPIPPSIAREPKADEPADRGIVEIQIW